MKKNTILAIVLLVAVVVAFSFFPLSSAKKPPKALKVTLSEDLETVASCDNPSTQAVDLVKGPRGTLESTGPVAVLLKFGSTHPRSHLFDDSDTWDTPACKVAELLRVRFDGMTLLALVLVDMDETTLKVKGASHREAFNLWAGVEGGDFSLGSLIEPVDGKLVSELHHFDRHTGKQSPDSHRETDAWSGLLAITGELS